MRMRVMRSGENFGAVRSLKVGGTATFKFRIRRKGCTSGEEFRLVFFMDDEETPDPCFFGSLEFVTQIEDELRKERETPLEGE